MNGGKEVLEKVLYPLLRREYGEEDAARIAAGYGRVRPVTLRVNTLKADADEVKEALKKAGIEFRASEVSDIALIIESVREREIQALKIYEEGKIYLQSLSSMLPPLFLGVKGKERVLDMAAAPGGKTTQIAALSGGEALITACEKNKIRAERLKYNVEKQGAKRVCVMNVDAAKLDDFFSFDRILLDAPCSGSGTIFSGEGGRVDFSEKLLKNSVAVQTALLEKGLKLLKSGGEMIYSTCSVLKEENEGVLRRVLPKSKGEIVPLEGEENGAFIKNLPRLPSPDGTLCVCPDGLYEGFFVAKIRKKT